jgi:hypothetical protein
VAEVLTYYGLHCQNSSRPSVDPHYLWNNLISVSLLNICIYLVCWIFWCRCYIRGSYSTILPKLVRISSILFSKYLCLIDTSLPLLPFFSPSSAGLQHMWIVVVKSMLVTSLQYVMQGKRMLSGIKTNLIISYSFSLPVSAVIYTVCPTVTHSQICILESFSHLCCS